MNTDCYFIRCKPHGIPREDQFRQGFISIGWPTGLSFEGKNWEEIAETIKNTRGEKPKSLEVTQCYNFVNIPIGSIILTPSVEDTEKIYVFKTLTSYEYDPDRENDGNPHTIRSALFKTVNRNTFTDQVQRSMRAARRTVTNFSKYADEILKTVGSAILDYEIDELPLPPPIDKPVKKKEYKEDEKSVAKAALRELLNSDNEEIKLKAALALLEKN
ncbi:conserved hypothetical protein [Candidatus Magnetomoraceae bacterium gMMP-15]